MASGEIDVTPGRVLSPTEVLDTGKLNDLGRPILRVKEAAITSRELAPGSIDSDKLDVNLEAQIGVADGSVTTAKIVDGAVTSAKLSSEAAIPTGVIFDFPGTTPPDGWLLCYGQAISRSSYSALFLVLGTTYGAGDGSTTFNIPDLRGRVGAGVDSMGGVLAGRIGDPTLNVGLVGSTLGSAGGLYYHVQTPAQMAPHAHNLQMNVNAVENGSFALTNGTNLGFHGRVFVNRSGYETATSYAGNGTPHNIVQPTMMLNKIIKAT